LLQTFIVEKAKDFSFVLWQSVDSLVELFPGFKVIGFL
jgi:hypothetical protein